MISDRLKIIRNVGVILCPKCSGEAHTAGTSSKTEMHECPCGYSMIRGHHSWVSAHGFRSQEHNIFDHYFKCDAILDLDSNEYIFVKRTYDRHELYPELGLLGE